MHIIGYFLNNQPNHLFIHDIFLFFSVFMSESQVSNHLGSKWTTEEYIQWNVMIEVLIEVSSIQNYLIPLLITKIIQPYLEIIISKLIVTPTTI